MTNLIQRDKKKRILVSNYELKRLELLCLIHDLTVPKDVRYKSLNLLNNLSRNTSKTRVKNRCVLTGRSHSVLGFCSLSRLKFRELASQGRLMGITKASW